MRATLWYCVQQPNCLRSLSFPKRTLQRKGFQKISVWLGRGQLAGSGAKILALQSSRRSPRVCGHVPFQDTQFVLSMANRRSEERRVGKECRGRWWRSDATEMRSAQYK